MSDDAAAQELAAKALIFIAQEPDRIGRFLAQSGVGPADIRDRARDPAFLGGILDHLLADESLLLEFAEWLEIEPESVGAARQQLPGAIVT